NVTPAVLLAFLPHLPCVVQAHILLGEVKLFIRGVLL
ncbi:MAG: hypothetical protein ACI8Z7_000841, partial [Candidatus Nanohaloarchaea archaeon]